MEKYNPRGTAKSSTAGGVGSDLCPSCKALQNVGVEDDVPLEDLVKLEYKLSSFHPVAL
jgi:hypothetical protein